jgi:Ca2+-binding RTX toxin-like protein
MNGGLGDDTYKVDSAGDTVTELAGQGTDIIFTTIGLDLEDFQNVENLAFNGAGDFTGFGNGLNNVILGGGGNDLLDGNAGNDGLTGGTGNDQLYGDIGNDVLDGGAGDDTMTGGSGNDIYVLGPGTDTIVEQLNQGIDEIWTEQTINLFSSLQFANIENLRLTGSGDFNGDGNILNNVINGNGGNNQLSGGEGNDTINGGAGNDTIGGGTGNDSMAGGTGDDRYLVNAVADKITELASQGNDTVSTTLAAYTLGANLENLIFEDFAGAAVGTGNASHNGIEGNASANKLDGQAGEDILSGLGGNDTLIGGAGNDALNGGTGADIMIGGAGNDVYLVDDGNDKVQEAANGGIDTVETTIDFVIANGSNIENINLLAGRKGTGNDANNVINGSFSADTIDGGKGHDSLFGNNGNDGISGGAGNDLIEGGIGADVLDGGAGNDVFLYRLENIIDLVPLGGDFISDFEVGKDRIDVLDLFSDFGITSDDPIGGGYLRLFVSAGDTLVQFDSSGGANSFVTLATLQGVTNASTADLIFPAPATNEIP